MKQIVLTLCSVVHMVNSTSLTLAPVVLELALSVTTAQFQKERNEFILTQFDWILSSILHIT